MNSDYVVTTNNSSDAPLVGCYAYEVPLKVPSPPPLEINASSIIKFEDGTTISGGTLCKLLKSLQRIIEADYPEELF